MMNELQKQLLEATISYYFDEINNLENPLDSVKVFKAILQTSDLNQEQEKYFKDLDIYTEIKQLRDILAHPCPQNLTTGSPYLNLGEEGVTKEGIVLFEPLGHGNGIAKEQQGILSLTGRDDVLNALKLKQSKGEIKHLCDSKGNDITQDNDTYYIINYKVTKQDVTTYIVNEIKKFLIPEEICQRLLSKLNVVEGMEKLKTNQNLFSQFTKSIYLTLDKYGLDEQFNIYALFDQDAFMKVEFTPSAYYLEHLLLTIYNRLVNAGIFDDKLSTEVYSIDDGVLKIISGKLVFSSFTKGKNSIPLVQYVDVCDSLPRLFDVLDMEYFKPVENKIAIRLKSEIKDEESFINLMKKMNTTDCYFEAIINYLRDNLKLILSDEKILYKAFDFLTVKQRFLLVTTYGYPLKEIHKRCKGSILHYAELFRNMIRNRKEMDEYAEYQAYTDDFFKAFGAIGFSKESLLKEFSLLLKQEELTQYYDESYIEELQQYRGTVLLESRNTKRMGHVEILLNNGVYPYAELEGKFNLDRFLSASHHTSFSSLLDQKKIILKHFPEFSNDDFIKLFIENKKFIESKRIHDSFSEFMSSKYSNYFRSSNPQPSHVFSSLMYKRYGITDNLIRLINIMTIDEKEFELRNQAMNSLKDYQSKKSIDELIKDIPNSYCNNMNKMI